MPVKCLWGSWVWLGRSSLVFWLCLIVVWFGLWTEALSLSEFDMHLLMLPKSGAWTRCKESQWSWSSSVSASCEPSDSSYSYMNYWRLNMLGSGTPPGVSQILRFSGAKSGWISRGWIVNRDSLEVFTSWLSGKTSSINPYVTIRFWVSAEFVWHPFYSSFILACGMRASPVLSFRWW